MAFNQDDPDLAAKLEAARADFSKAVANTIWSWASVDSYLILVFSATTKMSHPMASAIYFSVPSHEARFRLVQDAISELVFEVPKASFILEIWKVWINKTNRLKNTRNKIAHGQPITIGRTGGVTDLRLTPPFWHYQNTRDAQKTDSRNGFSGLSANDVKLHHECVDNHAKILVGIPDLVRTAYDAPQSLPEKYLELEGRLQTMGLTLGVQIPKEP